MFFFIKAKASIPRPWESHEAGENRLLSLLQPDYACYNFAQTISFKLNFLPDLNFIPEKLYPTLQESTTMRYIPLLSKSVFSLLFKSKVSQFALRSFEPHSTTLNSTNNLLTKSIQLLELIKEVPLGEEAASRTRGKGKIAQQTRNKYVAANYLAMGIMLCNTIQPVAQRAAFCIVFVWN